MCARAQKCVCVCLFGNKLCIFDVLFLFCLCVYFVDCCNCIERMCWCTKNIETNDVHEEDDEQMQMANGE